MHQVLARCTRRRRNVTVSPSALSDANGSRTLFIPRRATGRYSNQQATLREGLYEDVASLQVTTRRLDDEDVGPVGFIKIDVEGHEQSLLTGAEETLREHRPVLLVEIVEWCSGRPDQESFALICERGYRGLFFSGGLLRALETFDPARHPSDGGVRDFFFVPA
jgi:FkbM family methyltransferase